MKITFITTIFNEEKTIRQFLNSLNAQTLQPHEVVIVDGGSTDTTVTNIKKLFKDTKINLIIKKGNRSIGRNEAIKNATGDIIVCSDAGNILDKDWVKNIIKPFNHKTVDVVAGFYKGQAKTIFEKCLIPYVLVMPNKINPTQFLPATRSMAFKKNIWRNIGGFDEKLSHNEDYAFAQKLKAKRVTIVFAKDAVVYWIPRKNFMEAFIMFFRFAFGDAQAGIYRPKVIFLFARYITAIAILTIGVMYHSLLLLGFLIVLFLWYIIWSIAKNYNYVKKYEALVILPFLQITSDISVMSGTILGIIYGKENRKRCLFLLWIGSFFLFSLGMLVSFRFIRSKFPIPVIDEAKNLGFAQYNGYPLSFDTVVFFAFIFFPILSYMLLLRIFKHEQ